MFTSQLWVAPGESRYCFSVEAIDWSDGRVGVISTDPAAVQPAYLAQATVAKLALPPPSAGQIHATATLYDDGIFGPTATGLLETINGCLCTVDVGRICLCEDEILPADIPISVSPCSKGHEHAVSAAEGSTGDRPPPTRGSVNCKSGAAWAIVDTLGFRVSYDAPPNDDTGLYDLIIGPTRFPDVICVHRLSRYAGLTAASTAAITACPDKPQTIALTARNPYDLCRGEYDLDVDIQTEPAREGCPIDVSVTKLWPGGWLEPRETIAADIILLVGKQSGPGQVSLTVTLTPKRGGEPQFLTFIAEVPPAIGILSPLEMKPDPFGDAPVHVAGTGPTTYELEEIWLTNPGLCKETYTWKLTGTAGAEINVRDGQVTVPPGGRVSLGDDFRVVIHPDQEDSVALKMEATPLRCGDVYTQEAEIPVVESICDWVCDENAKLRK